VAIFGSLFGGGKKSPPPAKTFSFAFGKAGFEEVYKAAYTASAQNDEATMRAVLEFLLTTIPREEPDRMQASQPGVAATALGQWLTRQKRFAEAEAVMKRARGWKHVAPSSFLDLRFALADAIWEQGDRERAEKEALQWAQKVLDGQSSTTWPICKYRAKLAQYRFDFPERAKWEARVFEPSPTDKEGALEARRADPQLHLKAALAFHEAGQNTPALEHLERAFELATQTGNRTIAMGAINQKSYWLGRTARFEEIPSLYERALEVAGEDGALRLKARRIGGSIALRWGRFDEARTLLAAPEAEGEETSRAVTLEQHALLFQHHGQFDEARRVLMQKAALFPVASRVGGRMTALNHMGRVGLELRAHYLGERAFLDQSAAALEQAGTLLRGDQKLETWIRAFSAATQAARGQHESAGAGAQAVEREFETWSDSSDTQVNLAEALALCFLWMGFPKRAVFWAEWQVHLSKVPVSLASARELCARAHFQSGDAARARELWSQVAASDFDSTSVLLARRALEKLA